MRGATGGFRQEAGNHEEKDRQPAAGEAAPTKERNMQWI